MHLRHPLWTLANLLTLDACTCAGMGAALGVFHTPVSAWTGIPAPLLFWAGVALLPIAAFMAITARMRPIPTLATHAVIGGNMAWILASLALPITGAISPNPLGWAFLIAQAVFVALLTTAEYVAAKPALAAN
ncbi:hypothetical protein M2360_004171 [Rhizobium sp. SG_E_25_P2]|uniref:hypothetical protein n=1 Tax=Rhizobium sp. SG_E_25_P2 TaxID=2879942 RepID=UPI0024739331|nr:hypothetical protein [Rhizobium sp. SG_E_25_P2]MDH6268753.1 hypothetical protein [Rhizobium sp. SG_E_25_P2]